MELNNVTRLHNALLRKTVDRIPVTGLLTSVTLELMDRCQTSWPEAHFDASKMVTLAAAAHEYYGLENLKLPFDMCVEAEALGGFVDFGSRDTLPQVKGHLYEHPDEMSAAPDILSRGRIPVVLRAVSEAKRKYADRCAVVSSIVGPFTLATKLFGFDNVLSWTILEPDTLELALEKTTELCAVYAKAQQNAGSDVIQIGEAGCSGDLISGETYRRFIAGCHKELASRIQIPTVVHICGNITGHLPYLSETGVSGISLDEKTDIQKARSILKGKMAIIGYVPTLEVLLNGSEEDTYEKSLDCIKNGVDVLNAGCAWPPNCKSANIAAMVRAANPS